jgi:hypothetical protein
MYKELPNHRSIRLLDIAPGQATDPVRANLLIVDDLYEGAEFEALSYVWGTQDDPVNIICNKEAVSVTKNLNSALRRLRYADKCGESGSTHFVYMSIDTKGNATGI